MESGTDSLSQTWMARVSDKRANITDWYPSSWPNISALGLWYGGLNRQVEWRIKWSYRLKLEKLLLYGLETSLLLWSRNVHYHIHKWLSLGSILSQINPVQTFIFILLLSSCLLLSYQTGLFFSTFPTKFSTHFRSIPCVLHVLPTHHTTDFEVPMMHFSPASCCSLTPYQAVIFS
jgi:hypothetical protein